MLGGFCFGVMVGCVVDLLPVALEEDVMDGFLVDREDVVALIEDAARSLTGGDKMEAVALAMRRLMAPQRRPGTLYGALEGTVIFHDDVDLTAPVLDGELDALTGRELEH